MYYWILMWREMHYAIIQHTIINQFRLNGDCHMKTQIEESNMNKSLFKVFSAITILALMLMALPMQSAASSHRPSRNGPLKVLTTADAT